MPIYIIFELLRSPSWNVFRNPLNPALERICMIFKYGLFRFYSCTIDWTYFGISYRWTLPTLVIAKWVYGLIVNIELHVKFPVCNTNIVSTRHLHLARASRSFSKFGPLPWKFANRWNNPSYFYGSIYVTAIVFFVLCNALNNFKLLYLYYEQHSVHTQFSRFNPYPLSK